MIPLKDCHEYPLYLKFVLKYLPSLCRSLPLNPPEFPPSLTVGIKLEFDKSFCCRISLLFTKVLGIIYWKNQFPHNTRGIALEFYSDLAAELVRYGHFPSHILKIVYFKKNIL